MKRILFSSFLTLLSIAIQSQEWILQHPFSHIVTLNDIEINSNGYGFVAGNEGTIMVSSDFGDKWEIKDTPHDAPYYYIHSITSTEGQIVLAGGQKLARSVDGGENWVPILPAVSNIEAFHSLDENIVFMATLQNGIWKSTDSGENWIELENVPGTRHSDLYFFDEMNGIVCGSVDSKDRIMWTEDGGDTWTLTAVELDIISKVDFANDLIGYASGTGNVLKTTDGGKNWNPLPNSQTSTNDVLAINENVVWTLKGLIYNYSLDGGDSWSANASPNGGGNPRGIAATDEQNIWIVQTDTSIKYTSDGGQNWTDQVGGPKGDLDAIDMLDEQYGLVVAFDYLLKTINGGATWEPIPVEDNFATTDVSIIDSQRALLSGRNGLLYSDNEGDTWTRINSQGTDWIECLFYASDEKIYLGTISGEVRLANIDGSQSTTLQTLSGSINRIDFVDENLGFASTESGFIYRTNDGGSSWNVIYDNSGTEVNSIYPVSEMILLATKGFGNSILRSTDGGNSWNEISLPTTTYWSEFSFYENNEGYLVGGSTSRGVILRTDDAGNSWNIEFETPADIDDIVSPIPGQRLAWAAGEAGLIAKYSDCNSAPSISNLMITSQVCSNDTASVEVDFEGVDIFEWTIPDHFTLVGNDNSARLEVMVGTESGIISVKGSNTCGDETTSLNIELSPIPNPTPVISQENVVLVCETDAIAYQWYLNGQEIVGANTNLHLPSVDGSYYVRITSANGCMSLPSNPLDIVASSVNNIESLGVQVYPNPVRNKLFMEGLSSGDSLEILSLSGKTVKILDLANVPFDVKALDHGIYLIRVQREGTIGILKFIKL